MKLHVVFFAWLLCSMESNAQSIQKTMLRLPDTGQTNSYTTTFGEDNDYLINAPFFIDHADGTITDTITGLMWQKVDGGEMTIENAQVYCNNLTLAGYSDWRLPNAHEGFSILNHQNANPALNSTVFTTSAAEYWWTSDRQFNDSSKVWATNAGGGIGNHPKAETISAGGNKKFHVRAVRSPLPTQSVSSHFTDNADGTVTDNLTQLVWQKAPFADTLSWEQALTYADTLSLAGWSDWRLPNIKELQSINDEKRINPSLNPTVFSAANARKYWSSTTLPNQTAKAWYLSTQFGITTYDAKTVKHYVLCVKGPSVTTGVQSVDEIRSTAYPNPFCSDIRLNGVYGNETCQLWNAMGQLMYEGNDVAHQNFAGLPSGFYYLKIMGKFTQMVKLIKE